MDLNKHHDRLYDVIANTISDQVPASMRQVLRHIDSDMIATKVIQEIEAIQREVYKQAVANL